MIRIDIDSFPADALDVLTGMGAVDVELVGEGLAAILPDGLGPETVAAALGVTNVRIANAVGRDNSSVWLLSQRAVRVGGVFITTSDSLDTSARVLKLRDSNAFGTGHHPTTALCLEAMAEILAGGTVESVLDVGTGSGILALAALKMGTARAVGLDTDSDALQAAAENARLNQLADRLELVVGGPEVLEGNWPLVVANLLAAPLIKMAPLLVRRVGTGGKLVLSGIPWSLEYEVRQAYQHSGMRHVSAKTRDGWTVVVAQASW